LVLSTAISVFPTELKLYFWPGKRPPPCNTIDICGGSECVTCWASLCADVGGYERAGNNDEDEDCSGLSLLFYLKLNYLAIA